MDYKGPVLQWHQKARKLRINRFEEIQQEKTAGKWQFIGRQNNRRLSINLSMFHQLHFSSTYIFTPFSLSLCMFVGRWVRAEISFYTSNLLLLFLLLHVQVKNNSDCLNKHSSTQITHFRPEIGSPPLATHCIHYLTFWSSARSFTRIII